MDGRPNPKGLREPERLDEFEPSSRRRVTHLHPAAAATAAPTDDDAHRRHFQGGKETPGAQEDGLNCRGRNTVLLRGTSGYRFTGGTKNCHYEAVSEILAHWHVFRGSSKIAKNQKNIILFHTILQDDIR